ncbi:bifunctional 3-(3-hydroxy-phenyl)propionate/3-hydroxycinnamic acid hydroxylase [Microbacterium sp. BWT-B31]|uniref:bifunctional 3-(3-hydroxy-phenyl)propionate/3-hydroxycinnamic acid hydroxylase n=1 Tax=Microbacterium sp. BWT-B31 TaxID=3232072 RepID=UPI00352760C2
MNESFERERFDADIAIIGYGPSGVTAANTLASRGVSVVAFERDREIYPRARAVTVNDWTMRIFQDLGLDDDVLKVVDPQRALRWVTYDGRELMRVSFTPSTLGTVEGTRFYNVYQPSLEPVLRAGADRFPDLVSVEYGWEVTGVEQDATGVTITAQDAATGAVRSMRARYALACDGGSSPTRRALGIGLLGDTLDVDWIVIDCRVKRWWPDRDYLTFWSDKRRPVVDLPLPQGNHRWEIPLRAGEDPADFATAEQVWPLLHDIGVTEDDVDIHQHAFYKHHERMAERWREGRVFLVGDAAHLMPPWAGAGMQSGMRDAYDISWKLARVLDATAPEAILDTYEAERRPNVEFYTGLAIELGMIIKQELPDEVLAQITAPPPPGVIPPDPPLIAPPVLEAGWLRGPVGEEGIVGKALPQPKVWTADGWMKRVDDALGRGYVLLGDGIDPATLLTPAEKAEWDALGARYLTVRPVDEGTRTLDEIVDFTGVVLEFLRTHGARAVAVRPDRFIAASDRHGLATPDWPAASVALTTTAASGR